MMQKHRFFKALIWQFIKIAHHTYGQCSVLERKHWAMDAVLWSKLGNFVTLKKGEFFHGKRRRKRGHFEFSIRADTREFPGISRKFSFPLVPGNFVVFPKFFILVGSREFFFFVFPEYFGKFSFPGIKIIQEIFHSRWFPRIFSFSREILEIFWEIPVPGNNENSPGNCQPYFFNDSDAVKY